MPLSPELLAGLKEVLRASKHQFTDEQAAVMLDVIQNGDESEPAKIIKLDLSFARDVIKAAPIKHEDWPAERDELLARIESYEQIAIKALVQHTNEIAMKAMTEQVSSTINEILRKAMPDRGLH